MADNKTRGIPRMDIDESGKITPHLNKTNDVNNWLQNNTFHFNDFNNIDELIELKKLKSKKISLVIPTLNEGKTISNEVLHFKKKYIQEKPLLDEIIVIDSNSKDNTISLAKKAGARTFVSSKILSNHGSFKGKGENLWKSLYVANGDIILWIDADINDITGRFIYGILGPLLHFDNIKFSKSFYDRPIKNNNGNEILGGGRVTEILIRPLFNYFFKDLSAFFQPLSGEYAGGRELLEKLPYETGYGVETGLLIDIYMKLGLKNIAQVDLNRRIHRNRTISELSKMSFEILQTFMNKIELYNIISINQEKNNLFNQLLAGNKNFSIKQEKIETKTRNPMIEISEYLEKFHH